MPRTSPADILNRFHRQQRGQVLWLVAGLLAVFGGMAAMAVDLGSFSAQRRDLQNDADAIALAASHELPDGSVAIAKANEWAVRNGVDPSRMTVTDPPERDRTEPQGAG